MNGGDARVIERGEQHRFATDAGDAVGIVGSRAVSSYCASRVPTSTLIDD